MVDNQAIYAYTAENQAIVIPETIDAIRALTGQLRDPRESIAKTDTALGISFRASATLCFRGLDNTAYHILEPDRARYANYTGAGNTLNANHPIVRRMIVDSLRYWVEAMHVDGFRFDLASILARDAAGRPLPNPPVLWDIESDPVLRAPADCRGLGRGGPLAGRQLRRRQLEGVERAVP